MKFAIATIFTLALAMSIECSVIGLGHHTEVAGHGLAYTAVSGPTHAHVLGHVPHAAIAVHAPVHGVAVDVAHGAWGGHHGAVVVDSGLHGAWGGHGAVVVDSGLHGAWGGHGAVVVNDGIHGAWGGHHGGVVVDHGHHAAVVVAPHHEGSYVAKTRGALHAAPLAGHIASAAAINVAPAPGTI